MKSANDKLREALEKYGRHFEWCFCYVGDGDFQDNFHRTATDDDLNIVKMEKGFLSTLKCTCGFEQALEGECYETSNTKQTIN